MGPKITKIENKPHHRDSSKEHKSRHVKVNQTIARHNNDNKYKYSAFIYDAANVKYCVAHTENRY